MTIETFDTDTLAALPEGFTSRPAKLDDIPALAVMINAVYQSLIGEDDADPDSMRSEWQEPRFDPVRGTRMILDPDGRIAAFADFWDTREPLVRMVTWMGVHPDFEAHGDTLRQHLLDWALASARQSMSKAPEGARVVFWLHFPRQDEGLRQVLAANGFSHIRSYYEMRIELEAPPPAPRWPDGITVRPMVRGQDERAIVQAVEDGFADHWGHVEQPFEQAYANWTHHMDTHPRFDPACWWLAMDGEQIAGLSLCDPRTDFDEMLAWVDKLTVLRPWRQKGLGLALLLHSFGEFYRRGTTRIGLGVDAGSLTGALRLYEKAGMTPVFEFMLYELELRSGVDLMTQKVE